MLSFVGRKGRQGIWTDTLPVLSQVLAKAYARSQFSTFVLCMPL